MQHLSSIEGNKINSNTAKAIFSASPLGRARISLQDLLRGAVLEIEKALKTECELTQIIKQLAHITIDTRKYRLNNKYP